MRAGLRPSWFLAFLSGIGAVAAGSTDPVPMRLISGPALSPDGATVVFEWCDDLWIAPSGGGEAKRVVDAAGRDACPKFTPDGKRIVFSSDRSGAMEIHSKPVDGGETIRHSWNTEGNELQCLSSDGKRAIIRGPREHMGLRNARLMEIDLTRDLRERCLFDASATTAAWSPDGTRVLFCTDGEPQRNGYHGSRSSKIWLYQTKDRSFARVSRENMEERSPLWLPDGNGFYFVSNRDGISNLWLKRDGREDVQITRCAEDGVDAPALSADGGTLVFLAGLEVYRFRPAMDKAPVPIRFHTHATLPDISLDRRKVTGTTSSDFTPDLKQTVFSAAGELWRIRSPGGSAERLTKTAESEDDVCFSPDGGWLYFLKDNGLREDYHRARLLEHGLVEDRTVTDGPGSKCRLKPSPDGGRIAWVEGTGDVRVADADGASPHTVFTCWDRPTFDWSPDGQWLAIAAIDKDSNRDLWLVPSTGEKPAENITRHPAFDGSPKWSPDGKSLVFSSNRDDGGRSSLWKIDLAAQGFPKRIGLFHAEMIPTQGIEPTRVVWGNDSKSLWFQSADESSNKLYRISIGNGGMETVASSRGVPIKAARDGSLLWREDRIPEILSKSGVVRFPIDLSVERPREEVLALGFRRIWRVLGERYHDPEMNGRDWEQLRLKYEETARTTRSSAQFARVIHLLLGELNASHLAFAGSRWPDEVAAKSPKVRTAHPGIVFDDEDLPENAPLRVKRTMAGPVASPRNSQPAPGDTIVRIAGKEVFHRSALHEFFDDAEGRVLPVSLRGADGKERTIEIRCISYQKARRFEKLTEMTSTLARACAGGDIAYIRVPDMNRQTLREVELEVFRAQDRKGLILDLRNNGGGREADRLLHLFDQSDHAFTVPRDGPAGYPMDRLVSTAWNKPLVVLCNQNTFSNAEIFCHAIQQLGIAPLVGTTTAGGVMSAITTRIPDAGELQIPFRRWFETGSGINMDERGARPDIPVNLTPADENAGKDPQLEKALEILRGKLKPGP